MNQIFADVFFSTWLQWHKRKQSQSFFFGEKCMLEQYFQLIKFQIFFAWRKQTTSLTDHHKDNNSRSTNLQFLLSQHKAKKTPAEILDNDLLAQLNVCSFYSTNHQFGSTTSSITRSTYILFQLLKTQHILQLFHPL